MKEKIREIQRLKEEKNAVILAHYYVSGEVKEVADIIGDSFQLAQAARNVKENTIVICGVSFMATSIKLLNPEKKVLLPDINAGCPMAEMASIEKIKEIRWQYEDVAVVCYINSTEELKHYADVCVTSANAKTVISQLPNKNIFFIPDENLGRYLAAFLPDKNFIFNDGYCYVHQNITEQDVQTAKGRHPHAKVLVHPECTPEVVSMADYAGSTTGIIAYANSCTAEEFIICTEEGVGYELQKNNPNKKFYFPAKQYCNDMKKITLDNIIHVLNTDENEINLNKKYYSAGKSLEKMMRLSQTDR